MKPSEWLRRIWYLINRGRFERELRQEMEAHRDMMGGPRQFGNTLRLREESRDIWGWNWIDDILRDLRRFPHAASFFRFLYRSSVDSQFGDRSESRSVPTAGHAFLESAEITRSLNLGPL